AHALVMKLKPLLDPFNHRHSPWSLNQENLENFMLCITSHTTTFLRSISLLLTIQSTQICTPAPGAPFQLYATPFIIYRQALKPPSAMLPRLTAPSPSFIVNGQASWSNYEMTTHMRSIPATIS